MQKPKKAGWHKTVAMYMFATVGLLSLINKFSCLVATSDFDRLRMFDRKYAKPRTSEYMDRTLKLPNT